jgi:hypothetical protein
LHVLQAATFDNGQVMMRRPQGWKVSALLFTALCTIVFAINLGILLWAAKHDKGPDETTLVLRNGNNAAECDGIANLNRWGHLLINVLSTLLLAGSNFCMVRSLCDDVESYTSLF